LKGYYFEEKSAGWLWAHKGLKNKCMRPKQIRWPVHPSVTFSGRYNVIFDPDDLHVFQSPGCYWQLIGGVPAEVLKTF